MNTSSSLEDIGRRVALHRTIAGLNQRQLAAAVRRSLSTIKGIEQGTLAVRLETLHAIAKQLGVATSTLSGDRGDRETAHPDNVRLWLPVRDALVGLNQPAGADEPATVAGVSAVLRDTQKAFRRGRYGDVLALLPALIRDAAGLGAEGRRVRSELLTLTAWLLVHTHQYDQAKMVLHRALDDATDRPGTAAAMHVLTWLQLRSGQLDGSHRMASQWADRLEPSRFSQATADELAAWGWMLIRVATTAGRDNQPGGAADALRLAAAAATAIGREVYADGDHRRPFGPAVVTAKAAELAAVAGRPDRVLALASTIDPQLVEVSPNWNRHRLDKAWAHARLGDLDAALDEFGFLREHAPQWLREQRYARDVFVLMIGPSRRKLPPRMHDVAAAIRWSDS